MSNVRVRFAPSPTGALQIGNIRTALWDWLYARHTGGVFVLRIEDTDKNREVEGGIDAILDALSWYGLDFDEGPGVGGPFGPYVQSERLSIYHEYAEKLVSDGHAYKAYDTPERLAAMREEQQKRGLSTGYDRRHRYLTDAERADYEASNAPAVIRLAVPTEGETTFTDAVYGEITVQNRLLDDAILLKSDGFPTYHLAATIDDHLMEISHVLRGEDWIPSAPLHILLYRFLGWTPPVFVHLPNMLGPDKKKFGKRNGAKPALDYGKEGYLEEALFNFVALQGWSPKEERDLFTREELVEKFDLDGILNRSPISDPEKLLWYNGQYLRSLTPLDLATRTVPFLQEAGLMTQNPDAVTLEYIGRVVALEQERMRTLAEAAFPTKETKPPVPVRPGDEILPTDVIKPPLADFFLAADDKLTYDEKATAKWFTHPGVKDRLEYVQTHLADLSAWTHEDIENVIRQTVEHFAVKGGEVIHPVRVAVSGRTTGPGLFETMEVLGRARVLNRLRQALGKIG